jgi:hypothetical protein
MKYLIESIVIKDYDDANSIIEESLYYIIERKMIEKKKMIMAEKNAWNGMPSSRQEKLYRDVIEEDEIDEMDLSREKPDYSSIEDRRGTRDPSWFMKNADVVKTGKKTKAIVAKKPEIVASGKGDLQGKQTVNTSEKGNLKEETVDRSIKSSSPAYKQAQTTYTNRVITGKPVDSSIASSLARDDMTPKERMSANKTQQINTQIRTPAPRAGGYTDARTNKPYVAPEAEQMPLRGPTTQGSSQVNRADKVDRPIPASPTKTNVQQRTTTVNKVNEEEESGEESSMVRSELNAITKDAKSIMSKVKGNKELEAWTQSKITKAADYLNSVADYMDGEEKLDEARIKLVKARIRGGKIERRKRVSNIPGMTLRGGQLKRMSAAERRRRKLGQRKGKLKRKAKMARTLMKRQRSLRRRKSLGI